MSRGPIIFLGVLLTFTSAWLALVLAPYVQLNALEPVTEEVTGDVYPQPITGAPAIGHDLYRAYGCMYCHSQQVRPEGFGADFERGWGPRRTVARDYIYDRPVFLGSMRTGPDLANIGARQSVATWHHRHLYDPQITSPGSVMPPYHFLYERRRITGTPSAEALDLPEVWAPPDGYEIVPTDEARALVAYLLSLNRTHPLEEAEPK